MRDERQDGYRLRTTRTIIQKAKNKQDKRKAR